MSPEQHRAAARSRTALSGAGAGSPLGTVIRGREQYGLFAAPVIPGRPKGLGNTPAINGLFRRGPAVGISQINAMATNIPRG